MKLQELREGLKGSDRAAYKLGRSTGEAGKPIAKQQTIEQNMGPDAWVPYKNGYQEGMNIFNAKKQPVKEERRAHPRPVWDAVFAAFKEEGQRLKAEGVSIKSAKDWTEKAGNMENKWTYVMLVQDDDAQGKIKQVFNNIVKAGKAAGSTVKVADTVAVFGTSGKPSSVDQLESITMDYAKTSGGYWLGIKFNEVRK